VSTNETPDRRDGEFQPGAFIAAATWQKARKPFGDDHEYALPGRGELDPEGHDRMVEFIREHGYDGMYRGARFRYLDVNGYTLWLSRAVFPPFDRVLINRRPAVA
jgi:hypothetical protein